METDQPEPNEIKNDLREKATAAVSQAQGYVTDTVARSDQYVREQPWPVVGGAFLIGLAVGALIFHKEEKPTALETVTSRLEGVLNGISGQLPSRKKLKSMAQEFPAASSSFIDSLGKKLNAW